MSKKYHIFAPEMDALCNACVFYKVSIQKDSIYAGLP